MWFRRKGIVLALTCEGTYFTNLLLQTNETIFWFLNFVLIIQFFILEKNVFPLPSSSWSKPPPLCSRTCLRPPQPLRGFAADRSGPRWTHKPHSGRISLSLPSQRRRRCVGSPVPRCPCTGTVSISYLYFVYSLFQMQRQVLKSWSQCLPSKPLPAVWHSSRHSNCVSRSWRPQAGAGGSLEGGLAPLPPEGRGGACWVTGGGGGNPWRPKAGTSVWVVPPESVVWGVSRQVNQGTIRSWAPTQQPCGLTYASQSPACTRRGRDKMPLSKIPFPWSGGS